MPVLTKDHCDEALMDFDDLKSRRSGLGTAAVTVFNKSTDIVAAVRRAGRSARDKGVLKGVKGKDRKSVV